MLQHNIQDMGTLSYVEFKDLNFQPKRMYLIHGVPAGEVRGKHGHKRDKQYLVCVQGELKVRLVTKEGETFHTLKKGDSLFVDTYTWGEQTYVTGSEVMLVLCSTEFDQDDYIYDINDVIGITR